MRYNITVDEWDDLLKSQNNRCAVCKTDDPKFSNWHTDHCHITGKVRGLLCHPCNVGLGMFKDNIEIMETAIEYLEKNND